MLGRVAAGCAVGAVVFACFAPTQIVLRFKTNLQSRAPQTAIQIGSENAYKQGAGSDGHIGELVVVPSDAHDALVEVKVALGIDGTDPNACFTAPANPRCVTAKRSYRFADHETRTFDVFLSSACLGVACGPGQSCNAQTRTCVDIPENETDPIPPSSPPGPDVDGGEDAAPPPDARADVEPSIDGSVGGCGPAAVATLGRDAPVALVATDDALFWIDPNGRLLRRAKTSAGPGVVIAEEVATVAAAGTTVVWTKGTTAFGRVANGAVGTCTLTEPASSLALRGGAQPSDPPSAMFVSGESFMQRYTAPTGIGGQCALAASFPTSAQKEIVATTDWLWARAVTVNNPVSGTPWSFVDNGGWNVTFPTPSNVMLAAEKNVAIAVVRSQAGDAIFYRLLSANQIATFMTRTGEPTITGLAMDATSVYWLETPPVPGATTRLYRAPFGASAPPVVEAANFPKQVVAKGLVVDNACIFTWAASADLNDPAGSIVGLSKNP